MSDSTPLMPKATAVWLVDNTALTFEQIAAFCGLHVLEVKGIADGDVAAGIKGMDPISSGQLSRDEIKIAEDDENHKLALLKSNVQLPETPKKRKARYTPTSRRHERPNAIYWLLRNHPELKDAQIIRLTGTTKPTLQQIRDRTHWNSAALVAQDPVALGLCTQIDLDTEVKKAAKRLEREAKKNPDAKAEDGGTLLPTAETTAAAGPAVAEILQPKPEPTEQQEAPVSTEAEEDARIFAKLKEMSSSDNDRDDNES
ncbi:MAG: DUF1013 domain-containing protein [Hyphomicrobiaceae bacterium]